MNGAKVTAVEVILPHTGARVSCASTIAAMANRAERFEALTLSDWIDDSLAVIDELTEGPLVLIGSSMGRMDIVADRAGADGRALAGMIGIAAAPDFTEELMWKNFPPGRAGSDPAPTASWRHPRSHQPDPASGDARRRSKRAGATW